MEKRKAADFPEDDTKRKIFCSDELGRFNLAMLVFIYDDINFIRCLLDDTITLLHAAASVDLKERVNIITIWSRYTVELSSALYFSHSIVNVAEKNNCTDVEKYRELSKILRLLENARWGLLDQEEIDMLNERTHNICKLIEALS